MPQILLSLRDGTFLTRERALLWSAALLIAYAAVIGLLLATAHGLDDYRGRPLGSDFSDIYAAGLSALHDDPASPFDPARQYAHEQALFGQATPFYGWHYPPFFLLIAVLLARLAYIPSLAAWQLASLAVYLAGTFALLRNGPAPGFVRRHDWLLAALAFPAVFINLIHGQNGLLTAALLSGALLLLDRRPLLAGILLGLMAYKPQFGMMIPVALVAEGRWRTIASAALAVVLLALVTTSVFGVQVWTAFFQSLAFTRTAVLEQGGAGFFKIQSAFALVRLWHGAVGLAYAVQALLAFVVGLMLFLFWRSGASRERKGAALCVAVLLATPYCFDYDMMALAPAIALMAAEGLARGFAPYGKLAVTALWLVPLLARPFADAGLPVGMPIMFAVFLFLVRNPAASLAGFEPLRS